jgi:hypothetical protein
MEPNSAAEALPGLYRAILDRVAELESSGRRETAIQVRAAATKAYSRAWDERARRELQTLLRQASRPSASEASRGAARSPSVKVNHPASTARTES